MVLALGIVLPAVQAQAPAPSPTSDGDLIFLFFCYCGKQKYCKIYMMECWIYFWAGTSIDQGIAYLLMLVALVLTYLIRPSDALAPHELF
ncbi:hypothetical protein B296_00041318 [Ensete ventricosum]|uniref:Uncharacterized protein n=1 Tax=Ensete ventricosum TaxID=4639 RepID=A0A426Z2M4_ENSVE|nr:hypothetical protein B296_00041318 [Ensete ventricosum]